jgi:hypothetical protein
MAGRLARIAGIALGFFVIFSLSQQATALRHHGQTAPGLSWAIGILSLLFLVGAFASERTYGAEENPRKDLLWGLGSGGIAIVLERL